MKPTTSFVRGSWFALIGAVAACTTTQPEPERTANTQSAVWTDGDFESGPANQVPPAPWVLNDFLNPNPAGYTPQNPQTYAGLNFTAGGVPATLTIQAATLSQPDPDMGPLASFRWPRYGTKCGKINEHSRNSNGRGQNINQLTQTMTVTTGDVDQSDGKVHVRFVVAPVLEDPAHPVNQQPYFFVQLTNETRGGAVVYSTFNFSNEAGVPWQTQVTGALTYRFTDWQLVDIAPGAPAINVGDSVKLWLVAAGCALGGHEGMLYVDGVGTSVPGLFVSGSGPAQANAGTNITYNLSYTNGSPSVSCTTPANCLPSTQACVGGFCAETNVVIKFTTPPGTTFQSLTPPAGATCTTPAVGTAGTITCTFTNPVGPGANGTFNVSVGVPANTPAGPLVCGNYSIQSTQETPLIGSKIVTEIGCTGDTDCTGGNWCHESATVACLPKLPNGSALPNDPPHTNPTLNGMCSQAAATLVCASGVCDTDNKCGLLNNSGPCNSGTVCRSTICDTNDHKCGYANGDGPCTVGTQTNDCRSLVCDMNDGKCGYVVGDGPCTTQNQVTVCRSGACSTNGNCEPMGGCNVDADCTGGKWCNEAQHMCVPKLANGTIVPSDPTHTNPTLNGMCTMAAGTLVCVSGVCDTNDNKCGYADGDGPCTTQNAGTVCRSGTCSTNGNCEPMGGCNVDADCMGGNWCNETAHMCTAKIANGGAIPNDGPHMNPTLNGTCTMAAGTLVCVSGVCDTHDNKCGYANGDGPCTTQNAGTVCRSGACSTSGVCEPVGGCIVNADCMAPTPICDPNSHMCVAAPPDGGTDGGRDSGAGDSGAVDSGGNGDGSVLADSGSGADSGNGDAALEDNGSVAGGGLSCSAAPTKSTNDGLAAVAGVVLAIGASARRRRR